ncbi:V-type ATP synthase subunit E [Flexithrix dorotheae]|uniref:V-type ATP synthase subunit E n=1 Tax=Flexithrix dorotheae TaxID=70993 RepID=UPI0003702799|nr:V-type ATP synthase subunit E [Flexithrix dorotheae]
MASNINNLNKLADQIYQEGIEKAEKRSEEILQEAAAEAQEILNQAQNEAKTIVEQARLEAIQLKRSVENELELKGHQFLSDLKEKIANLLSDRIIKINTQEAFADVAFLQSVISEVVKIWNIEEDFVLILPAELEDKLKGSFARSIQEIMPNVFIAFENGINRGFRIGRKSDNFQVSFSDEDFVEIFSSYLSEQANKLLFKESI